MGCKEKAFKALKMKATITEAKLYDVFDLWRRKPRQLAFNDTDVIVVKAKAGNKTITQTFFTCLKGDGTFSTKTPSRRSKARRNELAHFIKYYFKIENPEEYNIKERIHEWKGQDVEVEGNSILI